MTSICVDTGFFICLYQEKHPHHGRAQNYFQKYFVVADNRLVVPWPIVYETFVTKAVAQEVSMKAFETDWKRMRQRGRLQLLCDLYFRQGVAEECFDEWKLPRAERRNLSAADRVVRRVLADRNTNISAFITSNPKDFLDVCTRYRRHLLSLVD